MTKTQILRQASSLIRGSHTPLLICHISPDGDALGSLTGLAHALRWLGCSPIAACDDRVSARFDFIPGAESVVQEVSSSFDLIVTLDCSDLRRVGSLSDLPHFTDRPVVNIDHHITNLAFGDVNIVDPEASSTAEVLLELLDFMRIPLDETLATSLLTGIVTDTRGFRTSNVTPRVLEAALRLTRAGASLPYVSQHGLDRRPLVAIQLWGAALSHLRLEDGIVWTTLPLDMRQRVGYQGGGDAGLASFLVSADEAYVSVVFVEQEDGNVDVGLRALPGYDVAHIALQFGGGGHALAAGFNVPGPLEDAERRVLEALREDVGRQQAIHVRPEASQVRYAERRFEGETP
ncbi:MAG: DHH family phosphoesterase [Chloroflexota bacterium]